MCSTAAPGTDGGGSPDEEAPDFETAPSVEGWFVDARGRLWVRGRDGELARSVTSTAPWVAADLVDVDTGDVRALVRVTVPGGTRERALDREVLLNQSKVIGALAPLGANVSSANAKDVVRYLTDVERRYGWARPPRAKRGAPGVGRRSALGLHALRPGRGRRALRPQPGRGGEGAPLHGARGHARGVGGGRGAGARRVDGVPLRPGGELRLPAGVASGRADLHRLPLGALALRQDADLEGGGQRVGRPHRGGGQLLPHLRGHAQEHRARGGPVARHTRDHRRAAEQGRRGRPGGQAPGRGGPALLALARARARGAQQRPHDDAGGLVALPHDSHGRDPHRGVIDAAGRGEPHPRALRGALRGRARRPGDAPPRLRAARHRRARLRGRASAKRRRLLRGAVLIRSRRRVRRRRRAPAGRQRGAARARGRPRAVLRVRGRAATGRRAWRARC